jgi:hypothetical protein
LNDACFVVGCSYDIDDTKRANKYECYELGLPTYTLSELQTQASGLVKVESDRDRWLSKMGMLDATKLFDFLVLPNSFDKQRSAEIVAEMRSAPGAQAPVYGQSLSGGIDEMCARRWETTAWFAIRMGQSTFGIFDAFPDDSGRQAHLSGNVAAALMAKASELLAQAPVIEKVDVLAAKLP